jgi:hypothetical protein
MIFILFVDDFLPTYHFVLCSNQPKLVKLFTWQDIIWSFNYYPHKLSKKTFTTAKADAVPRKVPPMLTLIL